MVLFHRLESYFYSVFYAIAEPKMPGEIDMNVTKIQQAWAKILFEFIIPLATIFYGGNKWTTIYKRYVEFLHNIPGANLRML